MVATLKKPTEEDLGSPDLSGPVVIALALGFLLLFSGKIHFGDIYGVSIIGTFLLYFLLNFMAEVLPLSSIEHYGPCVRCNEHPRIWLITDARTGPREHFHPPQGSLRTDSWCGMHRLVSLREHNVLRSGDEAAQQEMACSLPSVPVLLDLRAHHHLLTCNLNTETARYDRLPQRNNCGHAGHQRHACGGD